MVLRREWQIVKTFLFGLDKGITSCYFVPNVNTVHEISEISYRLFFGFEGGDAWRDYRCACYGAGVVLKGQRVPIREGSGTDLVVPWTSIGRISESGVCIVVRSEGSDERGK